MLAQFPENSHLATGRSGVSVQRVVVPIFDLRGRYMGPATLSRPDFKHSALGLVIVKKSAGLARKNFVVR